MLRLVRCVILLLLACVFAGVFGVLHNQVSYSVSPEYFTKFKFQQFGVSPHLHDRVGAALVGWQASWWMGVVIGMFVIPTSLLIRNGRLSFWVVLRSYFAIFATTVAIGLTALLVSFVLIQPNADNELVYRSATIRDEAAFRRAGTMHNFSYLGALLGILTGLVTIFREFLGEKSSTTN